MTDRLCGTPHYQYPETLCTEPAHHYRPDRDPHAGPLIIDGRVRGGAAWDEPEEQPVTDRKTASTITDTELDRLYERLARAEQEAAATATGAALAITLVRGRAERAEAAIARVRELHTRVLRMEALVCAHCGHAWPCATVSALDQPKEQPGA